MSAGSFNFGNLADLVDGLLTNKTVASLVTWRILGVIFTAAVSPFAAAVEQETLTAFPFRRLSPIEAARAVITGIIEESEGADEALRSGIDGDRFKTLVKLAGNTLSVADAVQLWRLGKLPTDSNSIDEPSLNAALRAAAIFPKWWDAILEATKFRPSPEFILDALLEGQLEEEQAKDLFVKLGGDIDYFKLIYDTKGQAPTPTQALELLNRGIIKERRTPGIDPEQDTSYEQAFLEGPWRNKWLEPFLALRWYYPPPRTATAMYREKSITKEQYIDLLKKQGVPDEWIPAWLDAGSKSRTGAQRDLTVSTIRELYEQQLVDKDTAHQLLVQEGYDDQEAEYILKLAELRAFHRLVDHTVNRIRQLYTTRKISEATTRQALATIQLQADQIDYLIALWTVERQANVKTISPGEIVAAHHYDIISTDEAIQRLVDLGYTPDDAWILLSVRNHGPVGPRPQQQS
jgi:hypothetical protein